MSNFDGHQVKRHEVNWKGKTEVDAVNEQDLELDRLVIMVVSARVGQTTFKPNKAGDVIKTSEVKVQDFRVLTGNDRETAINVLAHGDDSQMTFDFGKAERVLHAVEDLEAEDEEDVFVPSIAATVKFEDPVIVDHDAFDTDDWDQVAAVGELEGTLGHIKDYRNKEPEGAVAPGPKVAKFSREELNTVPVAGEVQQIGSIYPEGHSGRDKVLNRFKKDGK